MQVVLEIKATLVQLQAAGHPDHQDSSFADVYELAQGVEALQKAQADLRSKADSWNEQVQNVQESYPSLLWLTRHQLVAASGLLQTLLTDGELPPIKLFTLRATVNSLACSSLLCLTCCWLGYKHYLLLHAVFCSTSTKALQNHFIIACAVLKCLCQQANMVYVFSNIKARHYTFESMHAKHGHQSCT